MLVSDASTDFDVICSAGVAPRFDADLKPGSCPNPLNLRARGVVPAALVATGPDDAALIDLGSVTLEGVPALRCVLSDVTAPWDEAASGSCCGTPNPDGMPDVQCHFDRIAVAAAICATHVPPPADGDQVVVTLRALTLDGSEVSATDCARITAFGCDAPPRPRAPRMFPPPRGARPLDP